MGGGKVNYEELKLVACAGIVTYNPEINKLKRNIDSLYKQVDKLVLIDNASGNIEDIEKLINNYPNVSIEKNEKNKGIAYALNQILRFADKNGYKWYISMDQDSCCSDNLVEQYAINMPQEEKLAVLSPYVLNNSKVTLEEYRQMDLPAIEEITQPIDCITSGALNNVAAARKIKGYNSQLFIDCVDVDFNLRLMLMHYKIYRINTSYMLQEMGEAKEVKFIQLLYKMTHKNIFRRLRYTPVYSDFRLYYISRNSSYMYRKYGKLAGKRMTPAWMRGQYIYYFLTFPISHNRISMLKAINKGKKDSKGMK